MKIFSNLFSINFYRYLFFKIRRARFQDYLFFDAWTLLIIASIFVINMILFYPGQIQINVPTLNIQKGIIENVLRATSIFIGIMFSFIVLSFNIFNRYFGRSAFSSFFANRKIKILFTLFVCAIALMVYSLAYFNQTASPNLYSNILFFLCIIFALSLVSSIFPIAISLLKESQNRIHISKLIKDHRSRMARPTMYYSEVEGLSHQLHTDPKVLIIEIGTVAIKEMDNATLAIILRSYEELHYEMQNSNPTDLRKVDVPKFVLPASNVDLQKNALAACYYEYEEVISSLFQVAMRERNEVAALTLLRQRLQLEKVILTKPEELGIVDHLGKYHGWNYLTNLQSYFDRALQLNEDSVCAQIIDNLRDYIGDVIEFLLPLRNFEYKSEDWESSIAETTMFTALVVKANDFNSALCQSNKKRLFQNVANLFSTLDLTVIGTTLNVPSQLWCMHIIHNCKFDSFNTFLKYCDPKRVNSSEFPFTNQSMVLRNLEADVQITGLVQAIEMLFGFHKLNFMALNRVKAVAFFLIHKHADRKKYETYLKIIATLIENLKNKITISTDENHKDIYLNIEKIWSWILQEVKKHKLDQLYQDLDKIVGQFGFKSIFEKDLKNKGYISDNNIA